MISFINIDKSEPYSIFQDYYSLAKDNKQKNIEAIYIASFSHNKNYVDSRIVILDTGTQYFDFFKYLSG